MTDQQHPDNLPPQQPGGQYQQGPPPGYGQQPQWQQAAGQYQQGPPPGYGAPPGYGPPQAPPRKRHRVRNTILAIAGAIVLIIIIASVASSGKDNTAGASSPGSAASSQAPSPAATTSSPAAPAAPAAPQYTPEQQQAIEAADQYLQMGSGFSRLGLIQQLDSPDGNSFPEPVAKFAVNHIKVNWDQQAVEAAKGYMQQGGFSYSSMVQQLESPDGNDFTYSQAVYGAKAVGL
jgi:Host cell surface-exposed lipoprotein